MKKRYKILYICYFGLREPLVQTQVLPYLREIGKIDGLRVSLVTFEPNLREKWTAAEIESEKEKLAAENIEWHLLPYHKTPSAPATLYDVLNGVRFVVNLHRKQKIDFLHARAHIAMLMAMTASRVTGSRTIFDIRGLIADEYADAGTWRENSKIFRLVKLIERKGIAQASKIVVLTERMRDYLLENKLKKREAIEVIPCCVDFLRVENDAEVKKNDRFELIYAGSITGLYLLPEMGRFFAELKKHEPNAFFRILTAAPPEVIRKTFEELKIDVGDYEAKKVAPFEVARYLRRAHLGISFRKPTFSQIAASPTKIPEYLACGLPVVANAGIGDMDSLIENENLGIVIKGFTEREFAEAVEKTKKLLLDPNLPARCREVSRREFDLDSVGGARYRSLYNSLIKEKTRFS